MTLAALPAPIAVCGKRESSAPQCSQGVSAHAQRGALQIDHAQGTRVRNHPERSLMARLRPRCWQRGGISGQGSEVQRGAPTWGAPGGCGGLEGKHSDSQEASRKSCPDLFQDAELLELSRSRAWHVAFPKRASFTCLHFCFEILDRSPSHDVLTGTQLYFPGSADFVGDCDRQQFRSRCDEQWSHPLVCGGAARDVWAAGQASGLRCITRFFYEGGAPCAVRKVGYFRPGSDHTPISDHTPDYSNSYSVQNLRY